MAVEHTSFPIQNCSKMMKISKAEKRYIRKAARVCTTCVESSGPMKCERCQKRFWDKNILRQHMKDEHSGPIRDSWTTQCNVCGENVDACDLEVRHKCVLNYFCSECGVEIQGSPRFIENHKKSHQDPLKCDHCDFKTFFPNAFTRYAHETVTAMKHS